jgi:cyclopropane fatty-acyl-phospholipid synthase-like methyltransferase
MSLKKINLITKNHKKTKRNYLKRMINNKVKCMKISKKYEFHYWDGKRMYGYGGYKYDGRWTNIAKKIIKKYRLTSSSKVLDIGCGKGHLVFELSKILNSSKIYGIDISQHALKNSPKSIRKNLKKVDVRKGIKYKKKYFDLVICTNLIHNLEINDLKFFLVEVMKQSKKTFISTESYRNEKELFNLQCWALTCESFFSEKEWKWVFKEFGYNRDYELIFFE